MKDNTYLGAVAIVCAAGLALLLLTKDWLLLLLLRRFHLFPRLSIFLHVRIFIGFFAIVCGSRVFIPGDHLWSDRLGLFLDFLG